MTGGGRSAWLEGVDGFITLELWFGSCRLVRMRFFGLWLTRLGGRSFERLARDGELTVHALTDRAGVSQPMVSRHLGVLKGSGLVRERREGGETHCSIVPQALAPLIDWMRTAFAPPALYAPTSAGL